MRVTILLAIFIGIAVETHSLPLPIGWLSDYANVLDRHGRERISALIEGVKNQFEIEIYILASWEAPYAEIDRYAYALLDSWNLAHGKTLLVVFLKTGTDWEVKVLAGEKTVATHPQLARNVEEGITDLVDYHRIEEAMVDLFAVLERQLSPIAPSPQPAVKKQGSRVLPVLLLILSLGLLAFFIHRRICPRCGRILRVHKSKAFGRHGGDNVVYYCRRCGYSRTKRGEG